MAFIKKNSPKIGDWVTTKRVHSCLNGTMTRGSHVKIIDIDSIRGYSIEDEKGNCVLEIGWTI